MRTKTISVITDRMTIRISTQSILYIDLRGRKTVIHLVGDQHCETYTTIDRLEQMLGEGFLRLDRGCIVAKNAIHRITQDGVELLNGKVLHYARPRMREVREFGRTGRQEIVSRFDRDNVPDSPKAYRQHYAAFDNLPIAFTDIEMIFNEEHLATDWLFRYVNPALARIEKQSPEALLTHSFRTLFPNMDDKWLCSYERTALYGETLEIMDYSPEIDTYLKIISFPTFEGHCGCLLFDLSSIEPVRTSPSEMEFLTNYLQGLLPPAGNKKPGETLI